MSGVSSPLVALRLTPGPALAASLEEIWARGAAIAPIDPGASPAMTEALLATLRPAAIIDEKGERPLPDAVPVASGTALVVPTSGLAKAAELSHAALDLATRASLSRLGAQPTDLWLCCLPTHHIAGIAVLLRARSLGTPAVIHPRFDPDLVAAERDVTHVSLVPTMLARLLDADVDLRGFRAVLLGGAPAGPGLLERAREAGIPVVTTYGMTETCGGCVYDGAPLDGVEVATDPDGRIRVRGPVLTGYRLRDDLTRAALDGDWLVTSDLGEWADGRLRITGRADDVVVSGGENVDTREVAEVLRGHPDVADAAAAGRSDPHWGEAVVAFCVARGTVRPSDEDLRDRVRAALGRAAAPKTVRWLDAIPRSSLGKVRGDLLMRDDGSPQMHEEHDTDG